MLGLVGVALAIIDVGLVLLFFRYELVIGGGGPVVYRFDRWSGTVNLCLPNPTSPLSLNYSGRARDFTSQPTK